MSMKKYKKKVPETLEELKRMTQEELQKLWNCYFQDGNPLIKVLWYIILCEKENVVIEQKHITRLNKYAKNPESCVASAYQYKYNLKAGSQIEKIFRGKKYIVEITHDGSLVYDGK